MSQEEITADTQKKKRQQSRKPQLHFPSCIEQELVEWYREYPQFYNLIHPEYKDGAKKRALMSEKAAALSEKMAVEVTREQLETWFKSMRTAWGKTSQKKSGSGAKKPTPKEEWIVKEFGFLKDHIHRRGSAKMTSGKVKLQ